MTLDEIRALTANDMAAVNVLITERLHSEVALVDQLASYIIHSGGKRLRPLLVLLAARACGYQGQQHIQAAAIIEFIHTATLLHDDVVDASDLRRGRDTANALWGNEAAVLVGDFLYSRAFEMMVELDRMKIMGILAHATNIIAEGEVLQLMNIHNADTSEQDYLTVIRSKTAKLFEAGTQLGAVLTEQAIETERALAAYGCHLGTAFQLIDDVLDYSATVESIGKNVGDDLAEGKPTLPLIYALRQGDSTQIKTIREAIEQGGRERITTVLAAIQATGALQYTQKMAQQEAQLARDALTVLPDSEYKQALLMLAAYAVDRQQ
ncbi:MAG: octaprenyl diphosphate synthase [Gammaproteobacteria bacterium]|nr:octaprenyl diphosphate synthase [Gammaproteobacteria bacterium]